VVTRAIRRGQLDRARVEEGAARVVAVQIWQARSSGERPVPADVAARAARAAQELQAAAY
jgi:beta-N-acetylhexosaminidase